MSSCDRPMPTIRAVSSLMQAYLRGGGNSLHHPVLMLFSSFWLFASRTDMRSNLVRLFLQVKSRPSHIKWSTCGSSSGVSFGRTVTTASDFWAINGFSCWLTWLTWPSEHVFFSNVDLASGHPRFIQPHHLPHEYLYGGGHVIPGLQREFHVVGHQQLSKRPTVAKVLLGELLYLGHVLRVPGSSAKSEKRWLFFRWRKNLWIEDHYIQKSAWFLNIQ